MALTIGYDGYGVVANADRETNDTGGSATGDWKELGGGTVGFNPDVPYFTGGVDGAGSMGSKYATKTGYSYIDGITALDFTGAAGNAEDNYLYCWVNIQSAGAFAPLATDGLSIAIGDTTGTMDHWKIAGSDDANEWSGGWKCFVVDPQISPSINNGAVLTTIDTIGIWIDTDISVRADSIFQSQITSAKGLVVTGTPTTAGEGLNEIVSWSTDLTSRAAGVFQKRGNTYFSIGSLTVGDGSTATTLSAYGSNIEYEESSFWNGSAWVSSYPATANNIVTEIGGDVDFINTSVSGFIDNKLNIDTSIGNASSFVGGTLKLMRALSVKATDVFDGVVFSTNDALDLGLASYDNCSFNVSGTITIGSSIASFTSNTLNPESGTTALSTNNLNVVDGATFNSGGTGHAVELTGSAGSYIWNATTTGYDTGSAGNGAQVGAGAATGDETIHITATTGTFEISVSDGATIPSVSSAGAVVNITAGQKTLLITGLIDGESEVNVRDGSVTIPNGYISNASGTTFSVSFSPYTSSNELKLQVTTPGYDYINKDINLYNTDVTENLILTPDPSWVA